MPEFMVARSLFRSSIEVSPRTNITMRYSKLFITLIMALSLSTGKLVAQSLPSPWSLRASVGYGQFTEESPADSAGLQHLNNPSSDPTLNTLGSLAAAESLSQRKERVKETHIRFGAEYLIGDLRRFGLTIGLNYESANTHCLANCGEFNTAYSLALANSGSTGSQFTGISSLAFQTLLPVLEQLLRPESYRYVMIDFGFNWHILPAGHWDPYLGMGLGLGACIGDYQCEALKIAPRLGTRWNRSEGYYFFAELEYQTKVFTNRDAGIRILSEPVISPALHLGIGWNL
ncbi:MAG: hypothetical protein CMF59_11955 [Leptospiraceae bacterium]|nr:hypothetical protein [Leptospiraceae bacterium]